MDAINQPPTPAARTTVRPASPLATPKKRPEAIQNPIGKSFKNYWTTLKTYPAPDLKNYPIGFTGTCCLVGNEPDSPQLLYIIDLQNRARKTIMSSLAIDPSIRAITVADAYNCELIAYETEADRCVVRGLIEKEDGCVQIFGIDTGEYITDLYELNELYRLPEKWKTIPALAMLVRSVDPIESFKFRSQQKYEFKVLHVENDVLHVKITPHAPKPAIVRDDKVDEDASPPSFNEKLPEKSNNSMDAGKSLDTKDSSRFCKYFNEKLESCNKGQNGSKIHEDKKEVKIEAKKEVKIEAKKEEVKIVTDIDLKMKTPAIGQTIDITPSYILSLNVFYAHIFESDKNERRKYMDLQRFQNQINSPEEIQKYRKFNADLFPAIGELVLAKYSDGMYYRGKVTDIANSQFVKVFFLDYGNDDMIEVNNLFIWDKAFEAIPFQAHRFVIANIEPMPSISSTKGAEALTKAVAGKRIFAEVM